MTDASPIELERAADQAAASGNRAQAIALLEQALARGEQPGLWLKLSAMRRASGDFPAALTAVDRALSLAPLDVSALLARAFLLEKLKDPRATAAFAIAAANAPPEESLSGPMASAVAHARARAADHVRESEEQLLASLPPAARASKRVERFVSNTARRTRHYHQEPTHFHFPALPEIEFHDTAQWPALEALSAAADAIRAEFEAVMAAEAAELVPYIQYPDRVPLRQWKALNRNRDWTAIHLLRNGERVEANARHCPRTLDAIGRLAQPQVKGASPNAMFSLLAPRTKIPPHTGVANTRLVCHLPLIVPGHCGFRVGATTREWHVGEPFVFDDTIEHEAWNDSDELRVVLIFDLWAPALSEVERQGVAAVIAASGASFGDGI